MRRNLRLDWRALALLGALLSIIIDWPGLVYAMPTTLPPVTATATDTAPIDTLNIINSDKILKLFPADEKNPVAGDRSHQKASTMKNKNLKSVSTILPLPPTLTTSWFAQETPTNEKQQMNEKCISISDSQLNDFNQKEQLDLTAINKVHERQSSQAEEVTESLATFHEVSLLNTHTKNTTYNTISTQTTTLATPTTIESSAKMQSNHHWAILSRTERSIQSPSSSSASAVNISSWGIPLALSGSDSSNSSRAKRISSPVNGSVLVRRSSDMSGLKSKRLNNSRNLHLKSNLDRNERSTVSHLSGPSRKIQLYIKNRFIQLLPDGTVNGTQDEQCDYIGENDKSDLHNQTSQLKLHLHQL